MEVGVGGIQRRLKLCSHCAKRVTRKKQINHPAIAPLFPPPSPSTLFPATMANWLGQLTVTSCVAYLLACHGGFPLMSVRGRRRHNFAYSPTDTVRVVVVVVVGLFHAKGAPHVAPGQCLLCHFLPPACPSKNLPQHCWWQQAGSGRNVTPMAAGVPGPDLAWINFRSNRHETGVWEDVCC